MKGEDFVGAAKELANGSTEALHRSAVSRAYYGAFHISRRVLHDFGIRLPKGEQVHAKAIFCLSNCGDQNAGNAADELGALRDERNRADYDIDQFVHKQDVAKAQVARAQKIARLLDQSRAGPSASEFREKVRAQAKVLGLPVSQ